MTKQYTIKELAKEKDYSEVYLRRSISKDKLPTTKEKIAKNTFRHLISEEQWKEFRSNVSSRSQRTDGRNKFTLYATKDEIKEVRKALEEANLEKINELLKRTNKS